LPTFAYFCLPLPTFLKIAVSGFTCFQQLPGSALADLQDCSCFPSGNNHREPTTSTLKCVTPDSSVISRQKRGYHKNVIHKSQAVPPVHAHAYAMGVGQYCILTVIETIFYAPFFSGELAIHCRPQPSKARFLQKIDDCVHQNQPHPAHGAKKPGETGGQTAKNAKHTGGDCPQPINH